MNVTKICQYVIKSGKKLKRKELNSMEIEKLINKLKNDAKDVKEHLADYCYVEINDVEAIIEYLEQLKIIKE